MRSGRSRSGRNNNGVHYVSYLPEVLNAIEEAKERGLIAMGIFAKAKAVLLAPVGRTQGGNLRQKIGYEVEESKVVIYCNAKYAVYVEKGTGVYAEDGNGRRTPWIYYDSKTGEYYYTEGQKPQPFLTPAVFENVEQLKNIFIREMEKLDG